MITAPFSATVPVPTKEARPFFLLGVQRSGTTLLRLLLNAHSHLAIPFESMVLFEFASKMGEYNHLEQIEDRRRLVEALLCSRGIQKWEPTVKIEDIDLAECTDFAATVNQIFSAYARRCGKVMWGDKTPSYTKDFHIFNEMFPQARFIHLIRDGRDVALSLARQRWGPIDFLSALQYWTEVVTWSRKMGRMLPQDRYLEVRYEALVSNPQECLEQITAFLDLPFEEGMLERYRARLDHTLPASSRDYHKNLDRPIDRDLAYTWQKALSAADQALAYSIAGKLLDDLGYPAGQKQATYATLLWRRVVYRSKGAMQWRMNRLRRFLNLCFPPRGVKRPGITLKQDS
jgi:hypothetical protein